MNDDPWAGPIPDDAEDETTFWRDVRETAGADRHNQAERVEWFAIVRAEANRVPCRDCKQPVGQPCRLVTNPPGDGQPLKKFPAHIRRIADARKT